MNWREIPFLRLLIAFATGIALANWFAYALPWQVGWVALGSLLVALAAMLKYQYRFRWLFGIVLYLFLLLFGYSYAMQHDERRVENHFSAHVSTSNFFVGTVYDAPIKGAKVKIPIKVEAIGLHSDSLHVAVGNLLLFLDLLPQNEALQYGDRLCFKGKVFPAGSSNNPSAFDYKQYLHYQNIHFQSFVKTDSLSVLSQGNGYWVWQKAFAYRSYLLDLLKKHFPTENEYAVAGALLVGYKDDLSDEVKSAYAQTGSMHALAVSGTHVGVIFFGLMLLLNRIPIPARVNRVVEPLIALLVIWGFTLLTGASASVVRAAVMFSIFLIGKGTFRSANAWNVLPAAAFLQLLFNPYWLFDAGFQLSYAAVAGMVYFYPRFYKASPVFKYQAMDWAWSTLLVGVAAQLGTLPLTLYYFHQFPVYFWLSGWLVVFVGMVFLYASFFIIVFANTIPILANGIGWLTYYMVLYMNQAIFWIQKLPFSIIEGIWITIWVSALLYVTMGVFAAAVEYRKTRLLLTAFGLLAFLGICRAANVFNHFGQRKIVVYNLNKHNLIDFIDGETVVSLADTLTERQVAFAAENNRFAAGIRQIKEIMVENDTIHLAPNLLRYAPFVQFFDKKMAIINHPKWLVGRQPFQGKIDVVLLCGNPKIALKECVRILGCQNFVFDASNGINRLKKWKDECAENGYTYYDIKENGAWVCAIE